MLKPFRVHFFPTLRSTNDHAAVLRKRGDLFAPAIVLTSRQTAGRGRGGNTWFSPQGSITVTFVLAEDSALAPHHVPLAAGLAVRNAVAEAAASPQVQLKWPNDLVVPETPGTGQARPPLKKLAGLLCERLDGIDLIGLGLNVNRPSRRIPTELRQRIIFLQELAPPDAKGRRPPLDLIQVLAVVAGHLYQTLVRRNQTPFGILLREYDQHHALLGRQITVYPPHESPIVGKCEGLDDTGRLLLKSGRRTIPIIAGHVEVRAN